MYHEYSQDELRSYCRQNIENLETWARDLIHNKMTERYGADYINYKTSETNYLIKKQLREHIASMKKSEPSRYKRDVDALFIEDIIYFLCKEEFYTDLFKEALDEIYPDGRAEAKTILSRLVPIRNPLSHSNPISIHQVEQAICYSHDFIEGLKIYYSKKGQEKMYNVPSIIKIKDSLGKVYDNFKDEQTNVIHITDPMYVGDKYSLEIEVDPTFDEKTYEIIWSYNSGKPIKNMKNKKKFCVNLEKKNVGMSNYIYCTIIQNKEWHKYGKWDFKVMINFRVLPPND